MAQSTTYPLTITLCSVDEGKEAPLWARGVIPPGANISHFRNQHGEDWVALQEKAVLRITGLDIGWKEYAFEGSEALRSALLELVEQLLTQRKGMDGVLTGRAVTSFRFPAKKGGPRWLLGPEEGLWLMAVLRAALPSVEWHEKMQAGAPAG